MAIPPSTVSCTPLPAAVFRTHFRLPLRPFLTYVAREYLSGDLEALQAAGHARLDLAATPPALHLDLTVDSPLIPEQRIQEVYPLGEEKKGPKK